MNCPLCGTPNAYQGLMKISCENSNCKNFDPANAKPAIPIFSPRKALIYKPISIGQSQLPSNPFITPGGGIPAGNFNQLNSANVGQAAAQVAPSKITKQMHLAKKILDLIGDPTHRIIAGGAPRNWMFGRDAKDLDFYIYCNDPDAFMLLIALVVEQQFNLPQGSWDYGQKNNLGTKLIQTKAGYNSPHILKVFDAELDREKLQFMFLDLPPVHYVEQFFDFGLNKIWMNKDGFTDQSDDFLDDKADKTLTIRLSNHILNDTWKSIPSRAQKMKKYFPDHELRIYI